MQSSISIVIFMRRMSSFMKSAPLRFERFYFPSSFFLVGRESSSARAVLRSRFLKISGFTVGREQWFWMNVGWSVAILRVPTSLKTNSSRSNQNCSNHSSAVAFGSMFGSLLLTYRVTDFHGQAPAVSWKSDFDLRILVKSFGDNLLLVRVSFAVSHNIPSSFADGDVQWLRIAYLVHGWLESNGSHDARSGWIWPGYNRSGGGSGCGLEMICIRSPDAQVGIFQMEEASCSTSR